MHRTISIATTASYCRASYRSSSAIIDLQPGDVVVQRGTIHAWVNRGKATARVAFVLLDAKPVTHEGRALNPIVHNIRTK